MILKGWFHNFLSIFTVLFCGGIQEGYMRQQFKDQIPTLVPRNVDRVYRWA